jgi:hypothetical protein
MRGDQTLDAFTAVGIGRDRSSHQHIFENVKQLFGDLIVSLITSMVKRDQNFIGKAPAISRGGTALSYALPTIFFHSGHLCRTPFTVPDLHPISCLILCLARA